jgi:sugar phosphate isomerase/epimerase
MDYAAIALEHLGAFAAPLGVRLLVENLLSEATTPEHLMIILQTSHLDQVGVCLDLGHAHMTVGVADAIATFGDRIASVHIHDNHGLKDEHLWPGDGTIEWPATIAALTALPAQPAAVLEISQNIPDAPTELPSRIEKAFALLD